jgi:hypothetical protein
MNDLTIIYYTSNYLDDHNPYFLANTKKQLLKATPDLPIISVSQKPTNLGKNICLGDIGRSTLNIYRQILAGVKAAKTKYVAMAEDDILYSYEHFHERLPQKNGFIYNMNKWQIFTWSNPPLFSFINRKVINSLIANKDLLIFALEERFNKFKLVKDEDVPTQFWGEPGRYEYQLGVTPQPTEEFRSSIPNIVFNHPEAYGYLNLGARKKMGPERITHLSPWGSAVDILKLYQL